MRRSLLLAHGGGPTAVLNASLYGSIMEAKTSGKFSRILASKRGITGILGGNIADISDVSSTLLEKLPYTPGSAIGTGRDAITEKGYDDIAAQLAHKGITDVLLTGGNGTMDTTKKLSDACKPYGILVCGVPKTMDNDLSGTDHSPGYGSAARYLAGSIREVAQDVKGLAIHVVVIETFGRDAGWITASSALARENPDDGPDMILPPEYPFEQDKFLTRVQNLFDKKHGVIVVASEGLRYADGKPIVEPVFQQGRSVYFGDVSSHLSLLITKQLGIKSRSEKPGIFGRASVAWASEVDRKEAILCGRKSVEALCDGKNAWMSVIRRTSTEPYTSEIGIVPINPSVLKAKTMDDTLLDQTAYDVKPAFLSWLRPLVGGELGSYVSFL